VSGLSIWPPVPPGVYARRRQRPPFPFDRPGVRLFARARHGLWHAVRALGLGPGDEVLVPAYHHGSEVEALVAAGITPRFYEGEDGVAPPAEPGLGPRVRALYLNHALGFPSDSLRWRRWADDHRLLLIEDAAMAWLATEREAPLGSLGDAAIFCVYKSVGVPDGGAVVCRGVLPRPSGRPYTGLVPALRRHGAWAAARSRWIAGLRPVSAQPYDPERDFALGDPWTPPLGTTVRLLPRLARREVAAARRERFRWLAARLAQALPAPFSVLPPGAAPFVLPIEADDKPRALAILARAGIAATDLWRVPHPALPAERFPGAMRLRERVIGLPVHQELRAADLRRIADVAEEALR